MRRIQQTFERLKSQSRCALIPFVTCGDPHPEATVPLLHAMVTAGADIIELGVPFSDPMAEGPVIQAACERALIHHMSLSKVIDLVREFRKTNQQTPIVLMGYLNPIEVMGYAQFAQRASQSGVDGVLTVDIPPEEAGEYRQTLQEAGLDTIFLVAPTSTPERISRICSYSSGFVYYVSLKGVTGAAHLDEKSVLKKIREIRQHTTTPVGVGFGIKDADSAARIGAIADAVVVGSAIVQRVADNQRDVNQIRKSIAELLGQMRTALDHTRLKTASKNGDTVLCRGISE